MHSMNPSSLPPRRRLMRVAGCGVSAVVPKLRLATTASDTNCANTGAWCADTDRVSAQSAAMNSGARADSGSVTRTERARDDFATADTTHRVHNGNDDRADTSGGASIISGWDSVGPTNDIRNCHIRRAALPDVAGADDEAAAARAGAAGPSRTDADDASADRATPINASRSRSRSHSPSGSSHSDEDEAPHSEDDAPAQHRNEHAAEALVGALASMRSALDAVRTRITRRASEAIGECSSCSEGDSDAAPPVHICSCPRDSPDRVVVSSEKPAAANDSNTSVSEDDSDADTGADEDLSGASGAEDEDASGEKSDGEEEEEEEEQSSEGEKDERKPDGERESVSESASDADSANGDSEDDDSAAMPAATRAVAVPPSENENGAVDPKPAISVVRGIAKPFVQFVDRNRAALDRTAIKIVASALIVALVFVLAGVGINRARMRAAHAYGHHRWSSGPVTSELPRSLAEAAVRWKDGVTTPLGLTNAYIPGCVVQMKRCRNGAVSHKRALEGFFEQQSMLGGFVVSNSTRTASISGCEAAAYRWHERCNNIASERVHARFIESDRSHTLCVYPPRGVGFDLRKYLEATGVCSGSKECLDIADCFDHKGWGSERWTRERISNAELSACLPAFGQRLSWFRAGAFQHPSEWRAQTDCESLPPYTLAREAEAARRIAHDGASAANK